MKTDAMLLSEIKSRPIYEGLRIDPAARGHLVAAEGDGALAVRDAFAGAPDAMARTVIVYAPGRSGADDGSDLLAALKPDALHLAPTAATLLVRLGGLLQTATMQTRLYAAGTEDFIGRVVALAVSHGINHASIATEHRGSLARRVQCVHCKGFTDDVTASPVRCAHCGLHLTVRDHYSRRLGAFMGVAVDAESPGDVPEPRAFGA